MNDASNLQGQLHIPGLDYQRRRRKKLDQQLEKAMPLGADATAKDYIDDFLNSDAPQFKDKSREEIIRMALGAYYANKVLNYQVPDAEIKEWLAKASPSKDDKMMLQTMHDHSVKLGADCPGHKVAKRLSSDEYRIAKVDPKLGLVMGYAMICKVNGEPYYDLNIDPDGERVPEHIPEDAMLKAAADFMANSRLGNEMHSGDAKGTYIFAFPLTEDIAKAMGIEPKITGLMVAYKPPPDVLAKFIDGTYRGFSIEGRRITVQEHE